MKLQDLHVKSSIRNAYEDIRLKLFDMILGLVRYAKNQSY